MIEYMDLNISAALNSSKPTAWEENVSSRNFIWKVFELIFCPLYAGMIGLTQTIAIVHLTGHQHLSPSALLASLNFKAKLVFSRILDSHLAFGAFYNLPTLAGSNAWLALGTRMHQLSQLPLEIANV